MNILNPGKITMKKIKIIRILDKQSYYSERQLSRTLKTKRIVNIEKKMIELNNNNFIYNV
jgi:hypothetical protein